jgi:citrate lyase subunit beta/citryl-CoA lyase
MIDYNEFLMRSLMFVPAHNLKLMESALKRNADVLLPDIEDSVQPVENKQVARDNIKRFAQEGKFKNRVVFPRVNDRESGHLLQDVYQLSIDGIAGFMYPKAQRGDDIYFFGKLLDTIEYEKNIPLNTFKIIALIETPGAVVNINEICTACPERLIAVAFGCEDYMTELGGQHNNDYQSIFTARSIIAMGAKANGVIPIDTVHIKVHDLEDLEYNLKIGRELGFEGMLVLNPKELPLVHKYYSPTEEEIDWAKEMIELSNAAVANGKGVAVKDNKFIGPPMVKMANNILKKHELIKRIERLNG